MPSPVIPFDPDDKYGSAWAPGEATPPPPDISEPVIPEEE